MSKVEIISNPSPMLDITNDPIQIVEVIAPGPKGDGVPEGGTTAQVLRKVSGTNFDTEWHTLDKSDVGLSNVDNTSDVNKPISTAQQAALDTKEPTIAGGLVSQYWSGTKTWRDFFAEVRTVTLTGLSTATNAVIAAGDTVLTALGKLQKQVTDNKGSADAHAARTDNPHGTTAAQVGLGNVLNVAQIPASEKGAANGVTPLGADSKVPAAYLPSYVDDVLEYANLAAFPATGSAGIIYVAQNTNNAYRWSGSAYIEIAASPGSTDEVTEGTINKYYTDARVDARLPTFGIGTTASAPVIADCNDATVVSGMYYANGSTVNGPGGSGFVLHKVYGSAGFQLFQPFGSDKLYYRRRTGSAWQSWVELANKLDTISTPDGMSVDIGSTDLNTSILAGFYRGSNLTNAPDSGYWFVIVEAHSSTHVKQAVTAFGVPGASRPVYPGGTTFVRVLTSGVWGAWQSIGGGASGAGSNRAFYENDQSVTGDYTLTTGKNAMSAGPITINAGVTVTVPTGAVWTVV